MDFEQTLYALNRDSRGGTRRYGGLVVCLFLLAVWASWMAFYPLSLFEASQKGRIEVTSRGSAVVSVITGRVVENRLVLGKRVEPGEVLVRLDDGKQRDQVASLTRKLAALADQLKGRETQLRVETERLTFLDNFGKTSLQKAEADLAKTRSAEVSAREERGRFEVLYARRLVSSAAYDKARHDEEQRHAELNSIQAQKGLTATTNAMETNRTKARIAELQSEIAELRGAMAGAESEQQTLQRDIQNHVIIAAIAGRIGDVINLEVGGVLTPGERAATIVPDGAYRIVANFDPGGSLGRVRAGQPAKIRLTGFPWLQYGALRAEVVRVGSEVHDGLVRVELAMTGEVPQFIPMQHGLPGVVEIAVDRLTPWELLLRSVGKSLAAPVGVGGAKREAPNAAT